jgi:hypothetical protein
VSLSSPTSARSSSARPVSPSRTTCMSSDYRPRSTRPLSFVLLITYPFSNLLPSSPLSCSHFAMSRVDLYHVVKIKKLRTFKDIMETAGVRKTALGCVVCKPCVGSILSSLVGINEHSMPSSLFPSSRPLFAQLLVLFSADCSYVLSRSHGCCPSPEPRHQRQVPRQHPTRRHVLCRSSHASRRGHPGRYVDRTSPLSLILYFCSSPFVEPPF